MCSLLFAVAVVVGCVAGSASANESEGCFFRGPSLDAAVRIDNEMTVEMCADECVGTEVNYIGLQQGDTCYCIAQANVRAFTRAPSNTCTENCLGDTSQKCGGATGISVYTA